MRRPAVSFLPGSSARDPSSPAVSTETSGFTLIEVMVVLGLLALLMGLSAGFVQRAGAGNQLTQTANSMATLLATARAQSHGDDRAYVTLEADAGGDLSLRAYRNRQVFHFPCEDLESASELVINREGSVRPGSGPSSGEGRHLDFEGGKINLGNPPWLQMSDGFSIRCRIRPGEGVSRSSTLFKKGRALSIRLVASGAGRYNIEANMTLAPSRDGKGGGQVRLRTGETAGGGKVPEWESPVLAGRWQDVHVSYDQNEFTIHIDGRLRAVRRDKRNPMQPDRETPFLIGESYLGGFDSLVIAGIFEDDDDRMEPSSLIRWIDRDGQPITNKKIYIHFRNRGLDPRQHTAPVSMMFKLDDEQGARRVVKVTMSGENTVGLPQDEDLAEAGEGE